MILCAMPSFGGSEGMLLHVQLLHYSESASTDDDVWVGISYLVENIIE